MSSHWRRRWSIADRADLCGARRLRSLRPGVLAFAAHLVLLGCQGAPSRDVQAQLAPAPIEATSHADANPDPNPNAEPAVTPVPNADRVVFEVAGAPVTVTLADAAAIKAALLDRLQQSDLADRDDLINITRQLSSSIEKGYVRVAGWNLQVLHNKLQLMYRMPPGPLSAQTYVATVERHESDWVVVEIVNGHILRR